MSSSAFELKPMTDKEIIAKAKAEATEKRRLQKQAEFAEKHPEIVKLQQSTVKPKDKPKPEPVKEVVILSPIATPEPSKPVEPPKPVEPVEPVKPPKPQGIVANRKGCWMKFN